MVDVPAEPKDYLHINPESIADAAIIIRRAFAPKPQARSPNFVLDDLDEWFGGEWHTETHWITPWGLYKIFCWDMERYLEKNDWRLEKSIHYPNSQTRIPPSRSNFRKDGDPHEYWADVYLFAERDGMRIVIRLDPPPECDIDLYASKEEDSFLKEFWESFRKYHRSEGILKRSKFNFNFNFIQPRGRTWDDVKISDEKKDIFTTNVVNVMARTEEFNKQGLKTNRGLMLCGPPGCGKTLTTDALVNDVDETVIYVTTDTVTDTGEIKQIYSLARSLSPTLVVFEDIDALGGISRQLGFHPLLAEFLDALDGIEENSAVVTIASTNHPEMLDWALVDRPGRFDIRIDFDYPEPEFVVAILRKYLSRTTHEKGIDLKKLGRSCTGLSGAHLQEIVSQAGLIAFEENNQEMDFSISQANIEDALNRTLYNRRRYQDERQLRSKDDHDGGMIG